MAVDTLGNLLALVVTPANEQKRAQVGELAAQVQAATGQSVELAWVDQGDTGKSAAEAAAMHGIQLEVVKLAQAKRGCVLLPRRVTRILAYRDCAPVPRPLTSWWVGAFTRRHPKIPRQIGPET